MNQIQAFRDPSRCGACELRVRRGGCRARAYAATAGPLAEGPSDIRRGATSFEQVAR